MEAYIVNGIAAFIGALALAFGQQAVPIIKAAWTRKKGRETEVYRLRRLLRLSIELLYQARRKAVENGTGLNELREIPEELERWEESH